MSDLQLCVCCDELLDLDAFPGHGSRCIHCCLNTPTDTKEDS